MGLSVLDSCFCYFQFLDLSSGEGSIFFPSFHTEKLINKYFISTTKWHSSSVVCDHIHIRSYVYYVQNALQVFTGVFY